ncbi:hypothetical protein PHYC_03520 [Phycisphaerales bacterium]|nr:hypothetical protein PHYC_03520 [Phycisphaerales bacterium]
MGLGRLHFERYRGFSLVEMSVVILITAILAVAAIPAFSAMSGARQASGAEEIERRIVNARARALAEGRPVGLRVDPVAQTLRTFTIASTGAVPTPAIDPLGQSESAFNFAAAFPGVQITAVSVNGSTGVQTLWFAFDGTPQERSANGALVGAWTEGATVTVTGGISVFVVAGSGAVTR